MTIEQSNAFVAQRVVNEVVRMRRWETIDEVFADDYVDHSPSPGQAQGRAGLRKVLEEYLSAFPDLEINVEDVIVTGDIAVTREQWQGTHTGEFRGIAPTGRSMSRSVIHIFRIIDSQIVEEWSAGNDIAPQLTVS